MSTRHSLKKNNLINIAFIIFTFLNRRYFSKAFHIMGGRVYIFFIYHLIDHFNNFSKQTRTSRQLEKEN